LPQKNEESNMTSPSTLANVPRLVLGPKTAGDMMTPNPVSLRDLATIPEAVALFTKRKIRAAPVIDEAGRPVGVLSRTDILVHNRENVDFPNQEEFGPEPAGGEESPPRVRDIMTPVVFCVSRQASACQVVREMVDLKVHRLFVVEDQGTLVGVISVLDVLRHLKQE
jgi:CBS domain-containing protein